MSKQENIPTEENKVASNPGLERQNAKTDRLGTAGIGRLLLEFTIPCIAMSVFNSLYNLIDAAFLGIAMPDGSGVAVTTLALPIQIILIGFSMLAGAGGSTLGAILLGEGKKKEVERTLGNTTVLLIVIAAVVALIALVLIDPLLALVGTPAVLWEQTKAFVQIICLFFVFQSLGGGLNNFLRAAGQPTLAFISSALGTVICVILNYLFVLQFGWGVVGSAWATVIGQACGMLPVLWYFIFYSKASFRLRLSCLRLRGNLLRRIIALGMASFAMQVAAMFVNIVFNHVVTMYGAQDPLGAAGALGAIGVAQRVSWFAFTPIMGIAMGAQPIIGFNVGARNWSRALKTMKWSSIDGALVGLFFFAVCELFPEQIAGLFGIEDNLKEFAVLAMRIYVLWFPLVGYQAVASSYFQSSGQPLKATVLELIRQVIYLIPLYLFLPGILISLLGISGLMGVVICVPVSDMLSTITTTVFIVIEVRKLHRKMREVEQPKPEPTAA